jgi:outer membrane biogenesis lipoprotein LolB
MNAISETQLKDIPRSWRTGSGNLRTSRKRKVMIRATCGLRSWMQQLTLWQRGRNAQGNIVNRAQVVTHTPPGYSRHGTQVL